MSAPKFTPGPWDNTPGQDTIWANDGDLQVAKVVDLPWVNGKSQWIAENANARFIAAAPELLSALQACLTCLCADSDSEQQYANEIAQAKAAISKALGGEQ